jgi:hypothetical protein
MKSFCFGFIFMTIVFFSSFFISKTYHKKINNTYYEACQYFLMNPYSETDSARLRVELDSYCQGVAAQETHYDKDGNEVK